MVNRQRGFSLIELVVVMAIIAIIAAVALPSYRQYVLKAGRADARAGLLAAAQALERYYTENNRYTNATLGPAGVYPATTPERLYSLALVVEGEASYSLDAQPVGAQADDTECGTFTLRSSGLRAVSGAGGLERCW